jgi:hypothetical protein
MNVYEDLCKLVNIQCDNNHDEFNVGSSTLNFTNDQPSSNEDLRTPYASYTNSVMAREFIEAIGRVIEQSTFNELRASGSWSIMLDESNTVSTEKTLAIVSKHLLQPGKPIYRFLGMISLTEQTSNSIMADLNHFIQAKNILYDDLYHVCTDGASTMTGKFDYL